MMAMRHWSSRHARGLERIYEAFAAVVIALEPALRRIGYERLERPVAAAERTIKGLMFDCRMCGQCVLSQTGMSCPMNCPKSLRNGPCGGVRQNGMCEVDPAMRCVWLAACEGAQRMSQPQLIASVRPPLDHQLKDRSSWLAIARATGK